MLDKFSRWLQSFPCPNRSAKETIKAFQHFLGPQLKAKHVFSDNSGELIQAMDEMMISHDTCTPHRPSTNGMAERSVRRVKEGTSATLVQSGWDEHWWAEAMKCYCFLRNTVDMLPDGKTAYEKLYGTIFGGPIIAFGAELTYYPITEKDQKKTHKFGSKVLSGIFVGYSQQAGGAWTGDLLVADWQQVADAELFSDISIKRFKADEIIVMNFEGQNQFPLAKGDLKQPGSTRVVTDPNRRRRGRPRKDQAGGDTVPGGEDSDGLPDAQEDDGELEDAPGNAGGDPSEADKKDSEDVGVDPENRDYWTFNGDVLVRHHVSP